MYALMRNEQPHLRILFRFDLWLKRTISVTEDTPRETPEIRAKPQSAPVA
jgi:hypothetical protein